MKKRILALLLAVCVACSMLILPASASGSNTAVQTAVTLGGLTSDQTANLAAPLTRGALTKLMVAFSAYRESAKTQGSTGTLFSDVGSGSAYAPYVRIAVQQGWISGYMTAASARTMLSRWKKPAPRSSSCWAMT